MKSFPGQFHCAAIVIALVSFSVSAKGQTAISSPGSISAASAAAKAEASPAKDEQTKQTKPTAAGQAANETRDAKSKAPKVVRIRNGDDLSLEIVDLKDRLAKQPALFKTMKLFLDCKPVEGATPIPCLAESKVLFTLDQVAIEQITPRTKTVSVGVSFNDPLNAELLMPEKVQLVLITYDCWFWLVAAIVVLLAIILWYYGRRTSMLRDGQPPEAPPSGSDGGPTPGLNGESFRALQILPGFSPIMPKRSELAQYSLAKVQMAWWLFFIISSFLYIWLAVGDFNTLTSSTLILFGISAGTAVAGKMVDTSKQAAAQDLKATKKTLETQVNKIAPPVDANPAIPPAEARAAALAAAPLLNDVQKQEFTAKSAQLTQVEDQFNKLTKKPAEAKTEGFLTDIMSDENGVSIHRFQMVVWTVVLTIIFVYEVLKNLSMPEFSTTLLTLMGISSGTYVTLKVPEKKSVVDPQSSAG